LRNELFKKNQIKYFQGAQISERANHAMVALNNKIYVFGGQSNSGILSDAYVIDLGKFYHEK
jgi:N-acetylneuraminic acid mutarotase